MFWRWEICRRVNRVRDTDDDKYDDVELLREFVGKSEHGPHAVILGPDEQSIYICAGNATRIPEPETSRVPRNWQEDQVLTRLPDARGHAAGRMAPEGWVCKTDPDGKSIELVAMGFRNEYDIAFDPNGELFTFDADMEWDGMSVCPGTGRRASAMSSRGANLAGDTVRENGRSTIQTAFPR